MEFYDLLVKIDPIPDKCPICRKDMVCCIWHTRSHVDLYQFAKKYFCTSPDDSHYEIHDDGQSRVYRIKTRNKTRYFKFDNSTLYNRTSFEILKIYIKIATEDFNELFFNSNWLIEGF